MINTTPLAGRGMLNRLAQGPTARMAGRLSMTPEVKWITKGGKKIPIFGKQLRAALQDIRGFFIRPPRVLRVQDQSILNLITKQKPIANELIGEGINKPRLLKFANGEKLISKGFSNSPGAARRMRAEQDAYRLSLMMGLDDHIPPTLIYKGRMYSKVLDADPLGNVRGAGSLSPFMSNTRAKRIVDADKAFKTFLDAPSGRRIGLLDYITKNPDRHLNNVMYNEKAGKFFVIDNDQALSRYSRILSPFTENLSKTGLNPGDLKFLKDLRGNIETNQHIFHSKNRRVMLDQIDNLLQKRKIDKLDDLLPTDPRIRQANAQYVYRKEDLPKQAARKIGVEIGVPGAVIGTYYATKKRKEKQRKLFELDAIGELNVLKFSAVGKVIGFFTRGGKKIPIREGTALARKIARRRGLFSAFRSRKTGKIFPVTGLTKTLAREERREQHWLGRALKLIRVDQEKMEQNLAKSVVEFKKSLGQGGVERVKLQDGSSFIHVKDSFTRGKKESVFYNIATKFGLGKNLPTTVNIKGDVFIRYLSGAQPAEIVIIKKGEKYVEDLIKISPISKKLGVLDYVMGHTDRHSMNWLIDKQQNIKLIDNESLFLSPWSLYGNQSVNSPFVRHIDKNGFNIEDFRKMRSVVVSLERDIKMKVGNMQYEHILERINAVLTTGKLDDGILGHRKIKGSLLRRWEPITGKEGERTLYQILKRGQESEVRAAIKQKYGAERVLWRRLNPVDVKWARRHLRYGVRGPAEAIMKRYPGRFRALERELRARKSS